jgi:hypothetical protein
MTDRALRLPRDEALLRFLLAWPAATLSVLVPLSLGFFVSAWSRGPLNAVGGTIAVYLVVLVASEARFFADLRPYLFTSSMPYWRDLFQERIAWTELGFDAAKLAGFALVFVLLAFRRFRLREER